MTQTTMQKNQGVTLIEVLISLVILAIGLLGVVQLQVASVKLNHNAFLYSQATALAYDAFDRLRSSAETAEVAINRARWPTALVVSTGGNPWTAGINLSDSRCIDSNTLCNANQMAQTDLLDWAETVNERLPNGTARISRTTSGTGVNSYTVTIWWQERQASTLVADTTEQLSIQGEL